ncbi:MAG: DUF6340 family protein [Tannerellaceae bacterium]
MGCILMVSCASTRNLAIEYQRPAEITFPQNVTRILVINNTVPQEPTFGVKHTFNGHPIEPINVPVDSAAFYTVNSLSYELNNNNFFTKVTVLNESLRGDDKFELPGRLDNDVVNELALQAGADAIISLDHQIYNSQISLIDNKVGLKNGSIKVRGFCLFNVYIPFREKTHMTSMRYVDSLTWRNDDVSTRRDGIKEIINSEYAATVVCATGSMMGNRMADKIVPVWIADNRKVYSSYQSDWMAADASLRKDKWDDAVSVWEKIYEKSSSAKSKAKAANNIAVACELNDDYQQAVDWLNKAQQILRSKGENKEASLQKELNLYRKALETRIEQSKELNSQLRY